jgi:hypothetical protein
MPPIRRLAACTWPDCANTPAGNFCGRCRKRMYRLGLGVTPEDLPPPDVIAKLPQLWDQRLVVGWKDASSEKVTREAPAMGSGYEAALEVERLRGELGTLRGALDDSRLACSQRIEERDKARRELADARAVLGPRFAGSTESLTGDVQALLAYVRTVEEEGGHYALMCQHAHDELDRAGARSINNMGGGTPAERIRLLVADHDTAMGHRIAERDQFSREKFELVGKVDHLQREMYFLQNPPAPPANYVQTQPKYHPWLDEVTAGSLVLTPRDVKIAKRSLDALCDDNDMTDITFIADVLRVVLHLDEVAHG